MCDPVSIGSAAVSGLGAIIAGNEKASAERNAINARNAATRAEIDRQHGYQATTGAEFNKSVDLFNPQAVSNGLVGAQNAATTNLNANQPVDFGSIVTSRATPAAQAAQAGTVADVFGRAGQRDTAQGNLAGYGNQVFDNNLALKGAGRNIDLTASNARVSQGVGAQEADAAYNNASRQSSGIGEILSTLGGIGAGGGFNKMLNPMKLAPAVATGAPMSLLP